MEVFNTITVEWNETDNAFRAVILTNDPDEVGQFGAAQGRVGFVVADIFEADSIDTLREVVKSCYPDLHRYRLPFSNAHGEPIDATSDAHAFGDALDILKQKMFEMAEAEGADDVRRNTSVMKSAASILAARAAKAERERLDAEREEEAARLKRDREHRAEERKDFDAWASMVRAARDDAPEAYQLAVLMRWAYNEVDAWDRRLAEHVEAVTKNPIHALSWAGDFVQHAANFEVGRHIVDLFEAGVSPRDMEDEIMRAMFNKADRAISRSTSVMSNLTDDVVRVAYTEAAKRITGRSFW